MSYKSPHNSKFCSCNYNITWPGSGARRLLWDSSYNFRESCEQKEDVLRPQRGFNYPKTIWMRHLTTYWFKYMMLCEWEGENINIVVLAPQSVPQWYPAIARLILIVLHILCQSSEPLINTKDFVWSDRLHWQLVSYDLGCDCGSSEHLCMTTKVFFDQAGEFPNW